MSYKYTALNRPLAKTGQETEATHLVIAWVSSLPDFGVPLQYFLTMSLSGLVRGPLGSLE